MVLQKHFGNPQSPAICRHAEVSIMKLELTLALIRSFDIKKKPVALDAKNKIVYEENPRETPYFVFDSSPNAPAGFGLKVAGRKTFVIQKKVGGKTMRATMGSVAEFMQSGGLEAARMKAGRLASEMVNNGVNPNVAARSLSAAEKTLGQAFEDYFTNLQRRQDNPTSPETLKVYKRVCKRFEKLHSTKIRLIDTQTILDMFEERRTFATSNEQNFRTAYTVVQHAIANEVLAAAAAKREPLLLANPFATIKLNRLYRSSKVVERERREKMVRNPLSPSETLGKFLEALWAKRMTRENKTGCDYLLTVLLTGSRKNEPAKLKWAEILTEQEKLVNSWVDLKSDTIFFYKTKNSLDHILPLSPCLKLLLQQRQEEGAKMMGSLTEKQRGFVFPSRNKLNKTGHYNDAKDLLDRIKDIAGIPVLNRHDLRCSFGTMLISINIEETIRKRLMNHDQEDTHNKYTAAEWSQMVENMTRIEEAILIKGPNVWNALKPTDKSPLPAEPLPLVPKDKPRTGRPKGESVNAIELAEEGAEA